MTLRRPLTFLAAAATALTTPTAPAAAQSEPTQIVRITGSGDAATSRLVTLGIGKAAIVDLPADARDVVLSNPSVAEAVIRTSRRVFLIGRQLGQTSVFFFDAQGRQMALLEARVEPDVTPLNDLLRRIAPEARVRVEAFNGAFVLTGSVRDAAEADRIVQITRRFADRSGSGSGSGSGGGAGGAAAAAAAISGGGGGGAEVVNLLTIEGRDQVLVRVRVVEMSRTLVKQLGVNLSFEELPTSGDNSFGLAETNNGFSIAGRALGGVAAAGGVVDADGPFSAASLQAFERAGLVRILAEPNLTAVSGEAARFLAGGEFPVPVAADDGRIAIEFKPFGVGLAFTPVVLSGGRISLKLATEVSDLTSEGAISADAATTSTGGDEEGEDDGGGSNNSTVTFAGITIPALQVRRAETTVELPSGGAIVMAGLIQERSRQALEGIPGMKDLPVLGALFRSRDFFSNETELVIIVTPYIVRPTDPDDLRTPSDGYANATDLQSIFQGRLNAAYRTPASDLSGRRLTGPLGFVLPDRPPTPPRSAPE